MGWIRNIPRSLLAVTLANAGMFLKREARTATQSQSLSLIHKGWGAQTKGVERYASQDSDCVSRRGDCPGHGCSTLYTDSVKQQSLTI